MSDRFGVVAGHIVEYSKCNCGGSWESGHEPYCGVSPVMTLEDFAALVDAELQYRRPGEWSSPFEDFPFSVSVPLRGSEISVSGDLSSLTPERALALAHALHLAARYAVKPGIPV